MVAFEGKFALHLSNLDVSLDNFLDGRVKAYQPKKGFRAGIDSVLLAASVNPKSTSILELGSGSGVVSCCILADLKHASSLLVEVEKDALNISKQNLIQNQFDQRAKVLELDVTAKGMSRFEAGLQSDYYASTVANPPFFDGAVGTVSPDGARKTARHMLPNELDKWVKTAATSTAPKGEIIFIHTINAMPQLLNSFAQRFGNITVLPIAARVGESATRLLIRGIKGSKAPLTLLSPLIVHNCKGQDYTPETEAIFRGNSRLDW